MKIAAVRRFRIAMAKWPNAATRCGAGRRLDKSIPAARVYNFLMRNFRDER
jgi:hypothetical protein